MWRRNCSINKMILIIDLSCASSGAPPTLPPPQRRNNVVLARVIINPTRSKLSLHLCAPGCHGRLPKLRQLQNHFISHVWKSHWHFRTNLGWSPMWWRRNGNAGGVWQKTLLNITSHKQQVNRKYGMKNNPAPHTTLNSYFHGWIMSTGTTILHTHIF